MALQLQRPLPLEATEAHLIVELDVKISLDDLDRMPQELIDSVLIYRMVKSVIESGAEVNL